MTMGFHVVKTGKFHILWQDEIWERIKDDEEKVVAELISMSGKLKDFNGFTGYGEMAGVLVTYGDSYIEVSGSGIVEEHFFSIGDLNIRFLLATETITIKEKGTDRPLLYFDGASWHKVQMECE